MRCNWAATVQVFDYSQLRLSRPAIGCFKGREHPMRNLGGKSMRPFGANLVNAQTCLECGRRVQELLRSQLRIPREPARVGACSTVMHARNWSLDEDSLGITQLNAALLRFHHFHSPVELCTLGGAVGASSEKGAPDKGPRLAHTLMANTTQLASSCNRTLHLHNGSH